MTDENRSLWLDTTPGTDFPRLEEDISAEVAIIGGGIAGLTTAYMLERQGLNTVLLESDRIVRGVTGHTTAKITSLQGLKYQKIISIYDRDTAESYADANERAIELIDNIQQREGINCEFTRNPSYTYAESKQEEDKIREEVEAAKKAGLPAYFVENPSLPFQTGGAVKLEDQAYFHPRKYLLGLAETLDGRIFENTKACSIETGSKKVETSKGSVNAENIVLTTHFPKLDRGLYFARMIPRYSYALNVKLDNSAPSGMFLSTEEPFHSIRPTGENSVIIGGQNHQTGHGGNTVERYDQLKAWVRDNFEVNKIEHAWSTQDYESVDQVPYIGEMPLTDNIYLATGFGGWGMTNGTLAGKIISDIITRGETSFDIYNPSRPPTKAVGELISHNSHAARKFIGGRLETMRTQSLDLDTGEAEIVEVNGEKIAAYRDKNGKLHLLSAVCTHMNCILKWNNAEETWDCPCHGSRFDYRGNVLDGPANEDLERKNYRDKV